MEKVQSSANLKDDVGKRRGKNNAEQERELLMSSMEFMVFVISSKKHKKKSIRIHSNYFQQGSR